MITLRLTVDLPCGCEMHHQDTSRKNPINAAHLAALAKDMADGLAARHEHYMARNHHRCPVPIGIPAIKFGPLDEKDLDLG